RIPPPEDNGDRGPQQSQDRGDRRARSPEMRRFRRSGRPAGGIDNCQIGGPDDGKVLDGHLRSGGSELHRHSEVAVRRILSGVLLTARLVAGARADRETTELDALEEQPDLLALERVAAADLELRAERDRAEA